MAKEWFATKWITVINWPAQSPDLIPIETLWNDVDVDAIKAKKPKSLADLEVTIKEAWAGISVQRCVKLVESMPRRLAQVLKNRGYATKY